MQRENSTTVSPGKRELIVKNLGVGEPPEKQVDINDFGKVIEAFSDLFLEAIRQGEHHNRFNDITPARNAWGHGLGRLGKSPHRAEAEAVLGACIDVLRQYELISSALAIEDLVRQLEPPRHNLAAPPTITDTPEDPVSALLQRGSANELGTQSRRNKQTPTRASPFGLSVIWSRLHAQRLTAMLTICAVAGFVIGGLYLLQREDDANLPSTEQSGVGVERITIGGMLERDVNSKASSQELITTWVERETGGGVTQPTTWRGRILVQVQDLPAGDYRLEFVFVPEWAQDNVETLTANTAWFPTNRYLGESTIESREDDDDRIWLRSSVVTVPRTAIDSGVTAADTVRGRIVARYNPSVLGTRVEFGFVPEWALAMTSDWQEAVERHAILPSQRFLTMGIARGWMGRDVWLSSSIVEVPNAPSGPADEAHSSALPASDPPVVDSMAQFGGFGRCGSDEISVYWFDATVGTKHRLSMTWKEVTERIPRWDDLPFHHLSRSTCDSWPTGLDLTADDWDQP